MFIMLINVSLYYVNNVCVACEEEQDLPAPRYYSAHAAAAAVVILSHSRAKFIYIFSINSAFKTRDACPERVQNYVQPSLVRDHL